MNVTGLIYVAIVALWAAVLIPMWLRRHDDDQARRIERHRVAMGTLARIAHDPGDLHAASARRRRIILAATATVGALGAVAWVAGLVPGLVAAVLWIPLIAFLPAALISERRATRAAAERALDERRERRSARVSRPTQVDVVEQADAVDSTLRDGQADPVGLTRASRDTRARPVAWDEVFDQTA